MAGKKDSQDEKGTTPPSMPNVTPDYGGSVTISHLVEMMMEVQKTLSSLDAKVGRVITDIEKVESRFEKADDKLQKLQDKLNLFTGIAIGISGVIAVLWAVVTFVVPMLPHQATVQTPPAAQTSTQAQP